MEVFILADRFQNNIEVSTTICILKFVQNSLYGTKPVFLDYLDQPQYAVDLSYP
jgi:hypothetical protein